MSEIAHDLRAASNEIPPENGAAINGGEPSTANPLRPIADILAEWRGAERELESALVGSPEAADAQLLADRLREEYRIASEQRQR